jgi:DNA adenine methylase
LSTHEVSPLKGIAPYVGGKRLLASTIIDIIEKIPHDAYVEPFVGMGGVFFRRRRRPKLEVVNDLAADVATLFRVLQRHYVPFVDMLRHQLTCRAEFERLVRTDPQTLTDLERAARFFYLQKTCFGGKVAGRAFGVSAGERASFDVTRIIPELADYHERLSGVVIERLPFDQVIGRYDKPGTLFFLDPPYMGTEHYYGAGLFAGADFTRLADQLAGIQGRFILTINDCPQARRVFGRFRLASKGLHYGVGGGAKIKGVRELIVQGGKGQRGRQP